MQLAHAGRKAKLPPCRGRRTATSLGANEGAWQTLGPSALAYVKGSHVPREMNADDLKKVREDFVSAAVRARDIGFDVLELHLAHGYLLSSFLSPLSNVRTDAYGGSLENRLRFPLEVFDGVPAVWPRALGARITAHDWMGRAGRDAGRRGAHRARAQGARRRLRRTSRQAATSSSRNPKYGRMYQVPFAEAVRYGAKLPVITVGNIQGTDSTPTPCSPRAAPTSSPWRARTCRTRTSRIAMRRPRASTRSSGRTRTCWCGRYPIAPRNSPHRETVFLLVRRVVPWTHPRFCVRLGPLLQRLRAADARGGRVSGTVG